jgi:hypothetical protein
MTKRNQIGSLTSLVELAFKNQIVNTGAFGISVDPNETTIDNELLSEFDLRYLNSRHTTFDNGIEATFCVIGDTGQALLKAAKGNEFTLTIFNLDPENEPLELEWIDTDYSWRQLQVSSEHFSTLNDSDFSQVEKIFDDYYQSQGIQHLHTLVHIKMQY